MGRTDIKRLLPEGAFQAAVNSNSPAAGNPFLTQSDLVWHMPNVSLGDGTINLIGPTVFRAIGGGNYYAFDGGTDDEWNCTIDLFHNGIEYDGSDLRITLYTQLEIAPSLNDDVEWEVEYQFLDVGDDMNTGGATDDTMIDVGSRSIGQTYSDVLTDLTGVSGKKLLFLSIKRDTAGVESDSYPDEIWLSSIRIEKV